FGQSVSMSGDFVVIGAPFVDAGNPPPFQIGGFYVFDNFDLDAACDCPWDLDGDCAVGVKDLLFLLGNWGPCEGCPADFDDDGFVGVTDLLALLGNWGLCPCGEGLPPPSLAQELTDACLTEDHWEDFVDVMDDPTASQVDKDNYLCWMSHYLEDCSRCSCAGALCPGPDPFN
ncbi:MAG: FG-GAP repeat protein, partial [Gemmatimonadetes bacterium]|nr:FG-GAP repeat protein [Gemmatimonadota bacterium]